MHQNKEWVAVDYSKKIFLTFDIDWAIDEVIQDTCRILDDYNVSATFFITHLSPYLDVMRKNNNFELGIHPNFNGLLDGTGSGIGIGTIHGNFEDIISNLLEIVPEAVSFRSHCLTQGTRLSMSLREKLTYDLNYFIPLKANMPLKPFKNPANMLTVPFFFADDVAFTSGDFGNVNIKSYLNIGDSLKVFSFHPIHVFLNTECQLRYTQAKEYYKDYANLCKYINDVNFGTKDFLIQLLEMATKWGYTFHKINEIESEIYL